MFDKSHRLKTKLGYSCT